MTIHIDRLSRDSLFGEHLLGLQFTAGGQDYMLTGKLGDGAIGVVRKANNVKTNVTVAVKFLAPEIKYIEASSIDDIYRRFKREGQRGIELDHANLVKIIAYEENERGENFKDEGEAKPVNPFIVMEYIAGRTLEDYLKMARPGVPRGVLRINAETLYIASEIAEGLVHLHRHRIVHRDIKPANIFLSKFVDGQMPRAVKLGDFGIVKWGDFKASISTGSLTTTGQQGLGTMKYMAPEQSLDPQNVDLKSDVYALGITLYELFTNQILRDFHHVIRVRDTRMERGNTISRLHSLGIPFPPEMHRYEHLLDLIFDSFLKKSGRPTSTKIDTTLDFLRRKSDWN